MLLLHVYIAGYFTVWTKSVFTKPN